MRQGECCNWARCCCRGWKVEREAEYRCARQKSRAQQLRRQKWVTQLGQSHLEKRKRPLKCSTCAVRQRREALLIIHTQGPAQPAAQPAAQPTCV